MEYSMCQIFVALSKCGWWVVSCTSSFCTPLFPILLVICFPVSFIVSLSLSLAVLIKGIHSNYGFVKSWNWSRPPSSSLICSHLLLDSPLPGSMRLKCQLHLGTMEYSMGPQFDAIWSTPWIKFLRPYGVLQNELQWSHSIAQLTYTKLKNKKQ